MFVFILGGGSSEGVMCPDSRGCNEISWYGSYSGCGVYTAETVGARTVGGQARWIIRNKVPSRCQEGE